MIATLDQLKGLCQERKITVKPTLDKLVNSCPNESKVQLISKLGIYFSSVESTVKNTGTITSMLLKGEGSSRTKKNINDFLIIENPDVQAIACYPFITSISSICNGKGFPKAGDVDTLLKLPSLQKNGQLDRQLLSSISSMMSSRGFPKAGDVDTLLKLPSLHKNGQLDRQLLSSISSMMRSRGFPKAGDVDTLLKLPSLQKDGQLDRQLLSSISSMMSGWGFPKAGDVDTLLKLPSLRKDGQLDRQLLSSISSICHG
ncbi:hypothetical protein [Endozoicomonas sp. SCSIO W0465]|uniref:hypothetical protein n=1 Tax=Endozoicomonas sp. SCSIO W0465 TaxID=2918516 RepID=UPI0020756989|nr:hypothetical protein [Endozoicomonas sp. SCSIO W0465]USE38317.1 hypothetical protein MJO57_09205 [Endozoicomonas sp. SCSIO W0465]